MKKLEKDRLSAFLQQIGEEMPLFVPVQKEEGAVFTRWSPEVTPQLGAVRTVCSPKDLFFPPVRSAVHPENGARETANRAPKAGGGTLCRIWHARVRCTGVAGAGPGVF